MLEKSALPHAWFHPECPECRRLHFGCGYLKWESGIIRRIHPVEWWVPPDQENARREYALMLKQEELISSMAINAPRDKLEMFHFFLNHIKQSKASHKLITDGILKAIAGDFQGALEFLKKADEVFPENWGLQIYIIRLYMHVGNFAMAKQTCDHLADLLQKPPKFNPPPGMPEMPELGYRNVEEKLISMHVALSSFYLEFNEFAKSLQHGKKVLEIDPGQQRVWRNVGMAQLNLGNFPASIEAFQLVIPEYPGAADPWIYLGLAKQGKRDVRGAVQAFQEATRLVPNAFFAWFCLADAFALLGDFRKAEDACQRALKILPIEPLVAVRLDLLRERLALEDLDSGRGFPIRFRR